MKLPNPILPVALFLLLFTACERDLDFNLQDLKPELVVLANFSDLDTLEVVVSKSRPALDQDAPEYIPNANVKLFVDNSFADQLSFVSSPILQIPGYYLSSGVVPQPGEHLRVTVDAPGYPSVEAESTMPYPVGIDTGFTSLLIEIEEVDLFYNQANITAHIKILPPPGGPHYYHLNFYMQGYDFRITTEGDTLKTNFFSLPLVTFPIDDAIPLIPYIDDRGVLFTDDALTIDDGELSFTANFQYRRSDQLLGHFLIELRSASPEYYDYHRSLVRQYQAGQDPFAEPVILYSNVKNGQGIFAGFTSKFYIVK